VGPSNWYPYNEPAFGAKMERRAPFVSDPLQEHYLGRRGAIAVACVLSICATVGQCFAKSIGQIIGCRVITGLTLAAKASTAPLLTAEVAPNHLRGKKHQSRVGKM
jgi:MFS family permease